MTNVTKTLMILRGIIKKDSKFLLAQRSLEDTYETFPW